MHRNRQPVHGTHAKQRQSNSTDIPTSITRGYPLTATVTVYRLVVTNLGSESTPWRGEEYSSRSTSSVSISPRTRIWSTSVRLVLLKTCVPEHCLPHSVRSRPHQYAARSLVVGYCYPRHHEHEATLISASQLWRIGRLSSRGSTARQSWCVGHSTSYC